MKVNLTVYNNIQQNINYTNNNRKNKQVSMTSNIKKPQIKNSNIKEFFKNLFVKTKAAVIIKTINVQSEREAIEALKINKNFNGKYIFKNLETTSYFYKKFDPVTHENRIFADVYSNEKSNDLIKTSMYDMNGLKLSEYFVKIGNKKEAISIRRKDFNVQGKLIHEEIKYKNGDISNVDYDVLNGRQTTVINSSSGRVDKITSTKNYSETVINYPDGSESYNYVSSSRMEKYLKDKDGNIVSGSEQDLK